MVASIAENSGRSCVNASGVWTTANAAEIADALARRLAAIVPRAADDPRPSSRRSPIPRWRSGSPPWSTRASPSRGRRT